MEEKAIKIIMPIGWKPKGTFTLQECAAMNYYIAERQKRTAEAEKNGKKIEFFTISDITEIFKNDETILKNPKQVYSTYFIDARCNQIVQIGKVISFIGITENCRVVQLLFPSPVDQHSKYTDLIYNYASNNPELFGVHPRIVELSSTEKGKEKIESAAKID